MEDRPPASTDIPWQMVNAVEKVRQRLVHAMPALKAGGVEYAVMGGDAVAAWVARLPTALAELLQTLFDSPEG